MPNHVHGIIIIQRPETVGAILRNRPTEKGENTVSPLQEHEQEKKIPNTYTGLWQYISWFKRMVINEYIREVKSGSLPLFEKSIWQQNYHEHIIRSDEVFEKISDYIKYDPELWEKDKYFQ